MKIKGPLLSNLASGSIGPHLTFSQRKSGQQARYQKAQVDVITSARTTQRSYFDEAVGKWNSLSDEQRQQWNDFVN
jgi:hypothetical protein